METKRSLKGVLGKSKPTTPLWSGPQSASSNGGITFSLLSRYLVCKERFRIHTIEGLRSKPQFNHRMEYGNMWHVCEEALAVDTTTGIPATRANLWENTLLEYCKNLCRVYPHQQDEIDKWYNVCKQQFPIYVEHWSRNPDVVGRTNLLAEQVFHVPYTLPSRRTVWLRGKWDSADLISGEDGQGIWLQENKTKGRINPLRMQRQLRYDLQTMLYLITLHSWTANSQDESSIWKIKDKVGNQPILGVRYNLIRRPLSGGKGTITRHKAVGKRMEEPKSHFYARLSTIIENDPKNFFMRWKVLMSPGDVDRFKMECLDPVLENLCDDYEWWDWCRLGKLKTSPFYSDVRHREFPHHFPRHYRYPFGVWNPLDEDGSSDLDEYLETGSKVGLEYNDNLFPELTEVSRDDARRDTVS